VIRAPRCGRIVVPRTGPNEGMEAPCQRPQGHRGYCKTTCLTGDRERYYRDAEPCPNCGDLKGAEQALCRRCAAAAVPPPWLDGAARLEAYMERRAVG
jgi:hypothetical protein